MGSTEYSTSLDMWGVGCIFVEMITGVPTFPGVKDTMDQLDKIFKVESGGNLGELRRSVGSDVNLMLLSLVLRSVFTPVSILIFNQKDHSNSAIEFISHI